MSDPSPRMTVEEYARMQGLDLSPEELRAIDADLEAHCLANGIPIVKRYTLTENELDTHGQHCAFCGARDAYQGLLDDLCHVREAWKAGVFEVPSPEDMLDAVEQLVHQRLIAIRQVINSTNGAAPDDAPLPPDTARRS